MYAASERQYTAAGGEVQVPRGNIYKCWKEERQEMDTQIGEANAALLELYRSVDKTGSFKHRKVVSFNRSLFRSLPMAIVLNLGL